MSQRQRAKQPSRLRRSMAARRFGTACAVTLLLALPPAIGAFAQTSASEFIFDRSHEIALTSAQLEGLSKDRLRLARNEIFARRGYIFSSSELRTYFAAKPWYRPVTNDLNKLGLSPTEQANIALIKRFEEQAPSQSSVAQNHPSGQASTLPVASASGQPALEQTTASTRDPANIGAKIRTVPCKDFELVFRGQSWFANSTPFGKPIKSWTAGDYDTVEGYVDECVTRLRSGGLQGDATLLLGVKADLQRHRQALEQDARAASEEEGRKARAAAMQVEREAQAAKERAERQANAAAEKAAQKVKREADIARVHEIRANGERLAADKVEDIKALGIGPDLLESTMFVGNGSVSNKFLTFYQFMGYVLNNQNLEKIQSRRWDIGSKEGNGFELIGKFPQKPTFGIIFTHDENDLYPTHVVQNDRPVRASPVDTILIITALVGLSGDDVTKFLIYGGEKQ